MTNFERVLIQRDGFTPEQAIRETEIAIDGLCDSDNPGSYMFDNYGLDSIFLAGLFEGRVIYI